jgi:hypothetical protein
VWDKSVADSPLLTVMSADEAVPDFAYGQLVAVTFYETVQVEDAKGQADPVVWRHLERHERGVILHGLYAGTWDNLGERVPLGRLAATAGYADAVTDHADAVGDGILPSYVPNALPNRMHPGIKIGRSDFDGCEGFFDALDETWTSLIRDIRLGQAHVLADQSVMNSAGVGPGAGRAIDLDQELFTAVNLSDETKKLAEIQFAIRVTEHGDTATALTERIVSTAGYSPQTFGLHIEGLAESGTALRMRENKTYRTQGRKQRYWKPATEHAAQMLLVLDGAVFGRPTPPLRPRLEWPELIDDPGGRATWISTLRTAKAISTQTAVALAQPHLSGQELDDEVARVMAEEGMLVEPPEPGAPAGGSPAPGQPAGQPPQPPANQGGSNEG